MTSLHDPGRMASVPTSRLHEIIHPTIASNKKTLQNWGGSFVCQPKRLFRPTTIEQCCAIIELARRIGDVEVRAMGRSHSPGDIVFTNDWIICMDGVKGILKIDHSKLEVTVLGGTYVSDIHVALENASPPLGMLNVGSISEQTIAGLISTATHGTGFDQPVISAVVQGMKIICPLETDQGGTQIITCSRLNNAELFNASLCGLGATGLIVEVTFKVDHLFRLKQVSEDCPFDFVFGGNTGYPCQNSSLENVEGFASSSGSAQETSSKSVGLLLAHGHKVHPAPEAHWPVKRVDDVSQIYPISYEDNVLDNGDEDDETTRLAQNRLEDIARSSQFVKLVWFPSVSICTVSRSNRTLDPIQTPGMLARWHHNLIGYRLSELLIYLSRIHPSLPPKVNRTIHYLTAPSAPRRPREPRLNPSDTPSSAIQLGSITEVDALDSIASDTDSFVDIESFGAGGAFKPLELQTPSSSSSDTSIEPLSRDHPIVTLVDVSHRVFNIDCLFKQYTDEWAIPFCHAASAIRAMRDWIEEEERLPNGERFHFPVEIRFADADGIWLSHCQGRRTCFIGLTKYRPYNRPTRYRSIFRKFEMLMRHYAGRPHWAKAHSCGPIELGRLYPHLPDFIKTMRRVDPRGIFRNPYIRRHLLGELTDDASPRIFKSRL